ncbi:hypothetical protein Tco_0646365 [Tanacetum coccineum]
MVLVRKVNTTPVDYAVLNQLSQDFEKRFVPKTELSAKQAFWSQDSMNSSDPSISCRPTKVEVPKELPKVSMVNTSLKKLKHHLAGFDVVVKERTTTTTITEGSWVDTQLSQEIFQRVNYVSNQSAPNFDQYFEFNKLKAQSQEKDTVIKKLKEKIKSLNGNMIKDKTYKQLSDSIKPTRIRSKEQCDALVNQVNQKSMEISDLNVEMIKVDVEPIAPKLLNNRTAHSDYLRHTQEQATILREHSKLDVNSKLLCVKCNGCMLFDNHDLCVLNFINDINARAKSKSVKKNSKRKVWKPTGKVFTNIRYTWRPTGRTFTIVVNVCPLTRITTTVEVPLRKPTALETNTPSWFTQGNLGNPKLMFLLANLRLLNLYLVTTRNPVNLGDP